MELAITEPFRLDIPQGLDIELLKKTLTYTDEKAVREYRTFKYNRWARSKDPLGYAATLEALKLAQKKDLVKSDSRGTWTYSGLAKRLSKEFSLPVRNDVEYPEPGFVPWKREPTKEARPYQTKALECLLQGKHAAVQIGTGLGKSFIILALAKKLALKTTILTPSVSIAGQIHEEFLAAFGSRYVGAYFGGKKQYDKLFTIAVGQSLTRIEPNTDAWNHLCKTKVFVADESHMTPAVTLSKVCFGLMASAPYRLFFSGTQMRGDGLDLLLEGIIGDIVYEMTVREGVDQGWLAKPIFHMLEVKSNEICESSDVNDITRAHLFYNPKVNRAAGRLASAAYNLRGHQVLILVDELEQFAHLLPHFTARAAFAHGGITKESKKVLPKEYWESDPKALVEEFNAGKLPILVGTSCISTGTDIRENKTSIYLMGGKSEVQVRQAVGRDTRLTETKSECHHFDFDVVNIEDTHRHAEARREIYNDIYGPVSTATLGA